MNRHVLAACLLSLAAATSLGDALAGTGAVIYRATPQVFEDSGIAAPGSLVPVKLVLPSKAGVLVNAGDVLSAPAVATGPDAGFLLVARGGELRTCSSADCATGGSFASSIRAVNGGYVQARLAGPTTVGGVNRMTVESGSYTGTFEVSATSDAGLDPVADVVNAVAGSTQVSGITTLKGFASTTLAVSGGEYRLNGGAWTTSSSTAKAGDTVELRVTAGTGGTVRTATLTVTGGSSISFSVTAALVQTVSLATATIPSAKVGTPFTFDFSTLATTENVAAGGLAWSSSDKPSWMTLGAASGVATGTPDASGTLSFTVKAQAGSASATRTYSLAVATAVAQPVEVAAGTLGTCARLSDGAVKCWGYGVYGQNGTGSQTLTKAPGTAAIASGATALSAGIVHQCAVVAGGVKCWGYGANGAMGNGTTTSSNYSPVTASVSGTAVALANGEADTHTCAVLSGGGLQCWGNNDSGQLGVGTTANRPTPGSLTFSSGVTSAATAANSTCAVVSGAVWCWGKNDVGQLGIGSTVAKTSPTLVVASGATQVAGGANHFCAIVSGDVKCWGGNNAGQLGIGSTTNQSTPASVALANVTKITAGEYFTCALLSSGAVKCWGSGSDGRLGPGMPSQATSPTLSAIASGATDVEAGSSFACAVVAGTLKCWGNNSYGQLGDGTATSRTDPTAVSF